MGHPLIPGMQKAWGKCLKMPISGGGGISPAIKPFFQTHFKPCWIINCKIPEINIKRRNLASKRLATKSMLAVLVAFVSLNHSLLCKWQKIPRTSKPDKCAKVIWNLKAFFPDITLNIKVLQDVFIFRNFVKISEIRCPIGRSQCTGCSAEKWKPFVFPNSPN